MRNFHLKSKLHLNHYSQRLRTLVNRTKKTLLANYKVSIFGAILILGISLSIGYLDPKANSQPPTTSKNASSLFFTNSNNSVNTSIVSGNSSNIKSPDSGTNIETNNIVTNEILIKIKPRALNSFTDKSLNSSAASTGNLAIDNVLNKYPGSTIESVFNNTEVNTSINNWYKITLPLENDGVQAQMQQTFDPITGTEQIKTIIEAVPKYSLSDVRNSLNNTGLIDGTDNNYLVHSTLVPNDPYYFSFGSWGQNYDDLWGLKKINSATAWDTTTGASNVVVADIDTGLDRTHPDIASNIWINSGEIPDNVIDDDRNGYIDDYYGWNWVSGNNNPTDNNGHGTHTAGTIAAQGNNGLGITGIAWSSKIMALKFLDSTGTGSIDNGAAAIVYAADNGAKVTSSSWGCDGCVSQILTDALQYAHSKGVINIAAAGNSASDVMNFSPANSDDVITVGSTSPTNEKSLFSNYGSKVDVMAPGEDILSLKSTQGTVCNPSVTVGTNYCRLSGTSMATPHVAGLAALALSANPNITNEQFRQLIRAQATDLGTAGFDRTFGYGLVEAGRTIAHTSSLPPSLYIASPKSRVDVSAQGQVDVTGVAFGPSFAAYKVEIGKTEEPTAWSLISSSSQSVATTGVLGSFNPTNFSDGQYTIRLTATNTDGSTYQFKVFGIKIQYFDVSISSPQSAVGSGSQDIIGTVLIKNGKTLLNYKIDYGSGNFPTSYQSTGVALENGGSQTITNGRLGRIDTSLLSDNQKYQLRVTATTTDGLAVQTLTPFIVDKHLLSGWPKINSSWPCWNTRWTCEVAPLAVNLDSDSSLEIVVGNHPNQLIAYRRDGSVVPGWPFTATQITNEFFRHPAIAADLNGDDKPEIIAVSAISGNSGGFLYILQANGVPLPGWTPIYLSTVWLDSQIEDPSPSIADINADGKPEIITWVTSNNIYVPLVLHAFTPTGSEIAGFPKSITKPATTISNFSQSSPPTVADLDSDGKLEIITYYSSKIYVFDNAGNLLPGWPQTAPGEIGSLTSQAVADLYGDGKLEVIMRGSTDSSGTTRLYAWNKNGLMVPGWSQQTNPGTNPILSPTRSLPVFDANGDGKDEVVASGTSSFTLHGLSGKQTINIFPYFVTYGSSPIPAELIAGNGPVMSRDECPNFFINRRLYDQSGALSWSSANHLGGIIDGNACFGGSPLIGDFNSNGQLDMFSTRTTDNPEYSSALFMWEIPGSPTFPLDSWLMAGHDAQRTQRWKRGQKPESISPPQVTITNPTSGTGLVNGKNVKIKAAVSSASRISRVEFMVDGQLICTVSVSPYACIWQSPYTSFDLSKTIQVRAYDDANNTALATMPVLVIGSGIPETFIDSSIFIGSTAQLTFHSDQPGTFQCNLDDTIWKSCTSGLTWHGLAGTYANPLSHTIQVRAVNYANDADRSPASVSLTTPKL